MKRVLDRLEQLDELAQRQHKRLRHGFGECNVQIHDGLHEMADVIGIQHALCGKKVQGACLLRFRSSFHST